MAIFFPSCKEGIFIYSRKLNVVDLFMKFSNDSIAESLLFPFTETRPIADIRIGITTIREKWERENKLPRDVTVPSHLIPDNDVVQSLITGKAIPVSARYIGHPWDISTLNDQLLREDFIAITDGRQSQPLSSTNQALNKQDIFLEPGAKVEFATLNASTGPIYIGKNAEVMEGSFIRGPFALCEGAVLKMGSKIYGATTIGPFSQAGGEIKNSVIFGYSNKSHEGYLGDSVVGEWCNLGAGTSNSNVKNTGDEVKIWNPYSNRFFTGGNKCGLFMGDYSRSSINTSFNTGTVVGVCSNIFGHGLTPTYIPSFSWGFNPFSPYQFDKAIRDITNWKKFKKHSVSKEEISKLKSIFANLKYQTS
jgi:UDP-N-acetylglucosamine diphosphorylase/glucosamine-1-phosphate N-acetyltransferase